MSSRRKTAGSRKATVAAAIARKRALKAQREAEEKAAEEEKRRLEQEKKEEEARLAQEAALSAAKAAERAANPVPRKMSKAQRKNVAKAQANLSRLRGASAMALKNKQAGQQRNQNQLQGQKPQGGRGRRPPARHVKQLSSSSFGSSGSSASSASAASVASSSSSSSSSRRFPPCPPAADSELRLRAPVCCMLGHVDVGKTKLLDRLRKSDVQSGEAAGITQQIGATVFKQQVLYNILTAIQQASPGETAATASLMAHIPGLVILDTPGHGIFKNMRRRGARICDVAVVVIDLMHGVEKQTKEVISQLARSKTKFVIALNKVDRCYEWNTPHAGSAAALVAPLHKRRGNQAEHTVAEFDSRVRGIVDELLALGLSATLVGSPESVSAKDALAAALQCQSAKTNTADGEEEQPSAEWPVAMIPTSGKTGEGIGELLEAVVRCAALHSRDLERAAQVEAIVMEVRQIKGQPTTVDVVLKNGTLHVNDDIALCGYNGPMLATIKRLQTPAEGLEMRIKKDHYTDRSSVTGTSGVRLTTKQKIDGAIAGTPLMFTGKKKSDKNFCLQYLEPACRRNALWKFYDAKARGLLSPLGVHVQAPTHGSLEAMLDFLAKQEPPIPVHSCAMGALNIVDLKRLAAVLDPRKVDRLRDPIEDVAVLAFASRVPGSFTKLAKTLDIAIYKDETVYRVVELFREGQEKQGEERRRRLREHEKEQRRREAEQKRQQAIKLRKNNARHKLERKKAAEAFAADGTALRTRDLWKKELNKQQKKKGRDSGDSRCSSGDDDDDDDDKQEADDDAGRTDAAEQHDEGPTAGQQLFVSAIKTPALTSQPSAGDMDELEL